MTEQKYIYEVVDAFDCDVGSFYSHGFYTTMEDAMKELDPILNCNGGLESQQGEEGDEIKIYKRVLNSSLTCGSFEVVAHWKREYIEWIHYDEDRELADDSYFQWKKVK